MKITRNYDIITFWLHNYGIYYDFNYTNYYFNIITNYDSDYNRFITLLWNDYRFVIRNYELWLQLLIFKENRNSSKVNKADEA